MLCIATAAMNKAVSLLVRDFATAGPTLECVAAVTGKQCVPAVAVIGDIGKEILITVEMALGQRYLPMLVGLWKRVALRALSRIQTKIQR